MRQKESQQLYWLATVFLLFQRGLKPEGTEGTLADSGDEPPEFGRIRCPACRWQPRASSLWVCADQAYPEYFFGGCGTFWNTFDTRGLCPGCGHQWVWTTCLSCDARSLHEDWYEKEKGVAGPRSD